jgi:hypothetical protein
MCRRRPGSRGGGAAPQVNPRLGEPAVAVGQGYELFATVGTGADRHRPAQQASGEANVDVEPVDISIFAGLGAAPGMPTGDGESPMYPAWMAPAGRCEVGSNASRLRVPNAQRRSPDSQLAATSPRDPGGDGADPSTASTPLSGLPARTAAGHDHASREASSSPRSRSRPPPVVDRACTPGEAGPLRAADAELRAGSLRHVAATRARDELVVVSRHLRRSCDNGGPVNSLELVDAGDRMPTWGRRWGTVTPRM